MRPAADGSATVGTSARAPADRALNERRPKVRPVIRREHRRGRPLRPAITVRPGHHRLRALELAPRDGAVHNELGEAYLELGRLDDARAVLEAGLEVAPETSSLYFTLGRVLRRLGRPELAVAVLQRGIRLLPGLAELHNHLGIALDAARRREEAIAAYREAVRLRPSFTDANLNLAKALLQAGRRAEARRALERGLAVARQAGDGDSAARIEDVLRRIE